MPQQINLLTPILLAPRRYLSAVTLLQATGVLLVAGLVAALWLQQRDRSAEASHQVLLAQYAAERQQLTVARAGLPAPMDAASAQQQLLPLATGNAERRALLQTLRPEPAGQRHSDLLALVTQTLPEAVWLTELRYAPGRLELAGGTLDTAVLRPWLGRLAAHPLLAGQTLTALRVERLGLPGNDAAANPAQSRAGTPPPSGLPVWSFQVVSAPAAAASAVAGAVR